MVGPFQPGHRCLIQGQREWCGGGDQATLVSSGRAGVPSNQDPLGGLPILIRSEWVVLFMRLQMKREEDKPCPLFGKSKDKVSKSALTRYYGVAGPVWLLEKGYVDMNLVGYWKVLKPLPTLGEYIRRRRDDEFAMKIKVDQAEKREANAAFLADYRALCRKHKSVFFIDPGIMDGETFLQPVVGCMSDLSIDQHLWEIAAQLDLPKTDESPLVTLTTLAEVGE